MSYSQPIADPIPPAAGRRPAPRLSIVIPCHNEGAVMPLLLGRLRDLAAELTAAGLIAGTPEIVLVDDGSTDDTWAQIVAASAEGPVRGVRLSRNHGHQRALLAGLAHARGDAVVSMDADLQDDPSACGRMLEAYLDGAEIVFGTRISRAVDTAFKRISARAYYGLLSRLGVDLVPDHADFRLMSRKALTILAQFEETNVFLRGLVPQIGLATAEVGYDRGERAAGESKYPLRKMLALGLEGITSFSVRPLRVIAVCGFVIAAGSLAAAGYALVGWAMGATVSGWTSIVVPMYFLGGAHLLALGIIGEYVGKIYQETKRRPRFVVDEVVEPRAVRRAAPRKPAAKTPAEASS